MDNINYILSQETRVRHFGKVSVAANGFLLQRLIGSQDFIELLELFRPPGLTRQQFIDSSTDLERGAAIFDVFQSRGFIMPAESDEQLVIFDKLNLKTLDDQVSSEYQLTGDTWLTPVKLTPDSIDPTSSKLVKCHFTMLGGCTQQFLKDYLTQIGWQRGYDVSAVVSWPDLDAFDRIPDLDFLHVVVFNPGHHGNLTPLFDCKVLSSAEERSVRLQHFKNSVAISIDKLRKISAGRLIIIHNIARPQASPFGRADFRLECGFRELVLEANRYIEQVISGEPNMLLLDEDLIGSRYGLSALFDDMHFPFAHHGGIFDRSIEEPHQLPNLSIAYVTEYLDLLTVWRGQSKIKCIVCDLDGTLWPGISSEVGFEWLHRDITSKWIYFGIHEALKYLKERGIALVTCSKNSQEPTLAAWQEAVTGESIFFGHVLLSPDDFVLHKINWESKSQNIAEISDALGVSPHSMLFIDDNPAERAEVKEAFSTIEVIGDDIASIRQFLLTDPRLDLNTWTVESTRRVEMLKAQIQRDEARAGVLGVNSFLKGLNIRMTIKSADPAHIPRITELVQRTNQFNTSLRRYDAGTLHDMLDDCAVDMVILNVADRFADYGLVGLCILNNLRIDTFILSCRVIGLQIAVPFLCSTIRCLEIETEQIKGEIVHGPRNEPCRNLFLDAGFTEVTPRHYILQDGDHLRKVNQEIYSICAELATPQRTGP